MNVFTNLLLALVLTSGGAAPQTAAETPCNTNDRVCVTSIDAADAGIVYGVETNDRLMEMVGRIA